MSVSHLLFISVAMIYAVSLEAKPVPPTATKLDNNSLLYLRDKRTTVKSYPHRTMMFTGYYRPIKRSHNGNDATGVFAQGNAVSGGAYLRELESEHSKPTLEKKNHPLSRAQAEATPDFDANKDGEYSHETKHHRNNQHPMIGIDETVQTTELPVSNEDEFGGTTIVTKKKTDKKNKTPTVLEKDDDFEYNYEDEDNDPIPFVPYKGNKRSRGYFPFNNFFPMVFSFPGVSSRSGGLSGSAPSPGAITAVANSYSTSKGGIASSVATAYGGGRGASMGIRNRAIASND